MDRIKESFDSLPIAACFSIKTAWCGFINHWMLHCKLAAKRRHTDACRDAARLQSPPANVRCLDLRLRIYRFPDEKALRFAQEQNHN